MRDLSQSRGLQVFSVQLVAGAADNKGGSAISKNAICAILFCGAVFFLFFFFKIFKWQLHKTFHVSEYTFPSLE